MGVLARVVVRLSGVPEGGFACDWDDAEAAGENLVHAEVLHCLVGCDRDLHCENAGHLLADESDRAAGSPGRSDVKSGPDPVGSVKDGPKSTSGLFLRTAWVVNQEKMSRGYTPKGRATLRCLPSRSAGVWPASNVTEYLALRRVQTSVSPGSL